MPRSKRSPKRPSKPSLSALDATPLLSEGDVRTYLIEQAAQVAPADVESLVARSREVQEKATADAGHPLFHRQLDVALLLLADHVAEQCPQIPYSTVSLLAAALYYWLEPIDAIPDFIPGAGTSDDALVLQLAFQMSAAGLERYCTWKGIPSDGLLRSVVKPAPQPGARRHRR